VKRTAWGLVVAALALAGPAAAGPLLVPYEMFTLSNGLTVVLHEDHTVPEVSVNTWYHVGSARETPGHTGFAHLFEHLMFEGSQHVPEGKFDQWLESAGGSNNGSTTLDRTNYWENVPSDALELALFLESDRMGYLLGSMTPAKVDGQRAVVKNERRQSYENRPYGLANETILANLFPPDFPYHWPTIGSMADLTAATYDDVVAFFKRYYGPSNASLVVAGDIDPKRARELVTKWFAEIPAGPPVDPIPAACPILREEKHVLIEDKVQLPRLYVAWITPPAYSADTHALDMLAAILADGKNSRLHRRLVYQLEVAQDVSAYQWTAQLASQFRIVVTARSGHTLDEIAKLVDDEIEKLKSGPPTQRELDGAVNQAEASFLGAMERCGGFGGVADQMNSYLFFTGDPDYFNEDLAAYRALSPSDIQAAAMRFLPRSGRVVLSVVPKGRADLQVSGGAK
jgi:zinc protease